MQISGVVYGARDAAHQRMVAALARGEALPVDLAGQMIYYVGPAPAKVGQVIGPAGPTTSGRMDPYTLPLLAQGVKGFIGKGYRSQEVKAALRGGGVAGAPDYGQPRGRLSRPGARSHF